MTNQALNTEAWDPPHTEPPSPADATTVAVLGEDRPRRAGRRRDRPRRPTCASSRGGTGTSPRGGKIVAELAAAGIHVVCIGDDVPLDMAFGVAAIVDRDHPEMSVVLVASPDEACGATPCRPACATSSSRGGSSSSSGHALRRALERAARIARPAAGGGARCRDATTGRVIVVLSPKGGSGKTMVASNLAAALGPDGRRPGGARRPRRAVRRRRLGARPRARAHDRPAGRRCRRSTRRRSRCS